MLKNKVFYIISVYQYNNLRETNSKNHANVIAELKAKGFFYKELEGLYKGIYEKSILLTHYLTAKKIAEYYNQECFLKHDLNGRITSIQGDNERSLGYLKEIDRIEAQALESWSLDLSTHKFYGVM